MAKRDLVWTHKELAVMMAILNSLNPEEYEDEQRAVIERCRAAVVTIADDEEEA